MALKLKIARVLWYAGFTIGSAGLVGWLRAISIWYQYWGLPHSPVPETGNIYPLNIHGYVVYQTLQQLVYRQRWEFWSMAVLVCGATLGALSKLISERQGNEPP